MKTTISVICENTVKKGSGLHAEHGLSMLIQQDENILLDTGQSNMLLHNMNIMGIKPDSIDRVVISHGHYDHTGGLLAFLNNRIAETPVYVHPDAFTRRAAVTEDNGKVRAVDIGMQYPYNLLEETGGNIQFIRESAIISEYITAVNEIPRPAGWVSWDSRLMWEQDGVFVPDPFNDDTSLLINTDSGPVVCSGCAHAGIVEIIERIAELKGLKEIYAVLGGTHLATAPESYILKAVDTFSRFNVQLIAANHCTGETIAQRLSEYFPRQFVKASAGTVLEF